MTILMLRCVIYVAWKTGARTRLKPIGHRRRTTPSFGGTQLGNFSSRSMAWKRGSLRSGSKLWFMRTLIR